MKIDLNDIKKKTGINIKIKNLDTFSMEIPSSWYLEITDTLGRRAIVNLMQHGIGPITFNDAAPAVPKPTGDVGDITIYPGAGGHVERFVHEETPYSVGNYHRALVVGV